MSGLIIGMLWFGKPQEGLTYYEKKYSRLPNTIEMNEKTYDVFKPSFDGIKVVKSKMMLDGCFMIGKKEDVDGTPYLFGD